MSRRPHADGLDAELLARYLAGRCGEAEEAVVRRYLMAHPETARLVARFQQALGAAPPPAPPPSFDAPDAGAARWSPSRPRPAVRATPATTPPDGVPRIAVRSAPPPHWRRALVTLAASVLVVVGVGYGASRHAAPLGTSAAAARSYVTAPGERAELLLPDGTRARLAPGSRLRVSTDFGVERRDVFVEGEIYLDVVRDAERPFTVFAGAASVSANAGAFAVRRYPDDSATLVTVRGGEVALSGVGRVRAGERGRLSPDGAGSRDRVDADVAFGWLEGRLRYDGAPLRRVLDDVRRWYDVDVSVADPALLARSFTGALADGSPASVVAALASTLGLEARPDGGRVVLRAPGVANGGR